MAVSEMYRSHGVPPRRATLSRLCHAKEAMSQHSDAVLIENPMNRAAPQWHVDCIIGPVSNKCRRMCRRLKNWNRWLRTPGMGRLDAVREVGLWPTRERNKLPPTIVFFPDVRLPSREGSPLFF